MKITGIRTKREAVDQGLKALLRLKQQDQIRRYRGKLDWDGDLDDGIEADKGDSTTRSFDVNGLGADGRLLLRVERN